MTLRIDLTDRHHTHSETDREHVKEKVGKLTKDQVREIAQTKLPDLNANNIDAAMKIVEGTARSMGITTD